MEIDYDWYTIKEKSKRIGISFITSRYTSTHPNHIALWLVGKKLENYIILKNGEEILFPPFFISIPSEVTISTLDKIEKYLISWENNHKSEWESVDNPTSL